MESIAKEHKISDITFKRNIKLSHGFSIERGISGYLLDDNATEAIRMRLNDIIDTTKIDNLKENMEKHNTHWIYTKNILLTLPQYEQVENSEKTRLNYKIEQQGTLFI